MERARLIVVDDDILIRRKLAADLPGLGFHVDAVSSGPEALEQLKRETYDAVLLDHQLGKGPDGLEVLKELRRLGIGTPILMLTARSDVLTKVKALEADVLPATRNLDEPGEGCDLDYIPNTPREKKVDTILSNSFGFGGHNSCLVVKRFEG